MTELPKVPSKSRLRPLGVALIIFGAIGIVLTLAFYATSFLDSTADQTSAPGVTAQCDIGKECSIHSNTAGDKVIVFASKDALDEAETDSVSMSKEATAREMVALMAAGQVYLVPDGTQVNVLDESVLGGWHQVRIVDAGIHLGDTAYVLDKWTILERN